MWAQRRFEQLLSNLSTAENTGLVLAVPQPPLKETDRKLCREELVVGGDNTNMFQLVTRALQAVLR